MNKQDYQNQPFPPPVLPIAAVREYLELKAWQYRVSIASVIVFALF